MSDDRREALKIIGAIGATCAFPFSADELYAQHAHSAGPDAALPKPSFFTKEEMESVTRLAEVIIPGAAAAGVPAYIDMVVGKNEGLGKLMREGLAWLDRQSPARFVALTPEQQVALLEPLCSRADSGQPGDGVDFFRAMKNLTADGYYTSRAGLVEELGYLGNTVLDRFPACTHEH
ncbi:MAG: gluconate 2-dehydrogenase subunit 3 family protein [Acidimicrobiia bacterium]|nr:gluconate 2-dehydrogenase subunit 3 family protein [Acidimicrobiia bacterium]